MVTKLCIRCSAYFENGHQIFGTFLDSLNLLAKHDGLDGEPYSGEERDSAFIIALTIGHSTKLVLIRYGTWLDSLSSAIPASSRNGQIHNGSFDR